MSADLVQKRDFTILSNPEYGASFPKTVYGRRWFLFLKFLVFTIRFCLSTWPCLPQFTFLNRTLFYLGFLNLCSFPRAKVIWSVLPFSMTFLRSCRYTEGFSLPLCCGNITAYPPEWAVIIQSLSIFLSLLAYLSQIAWF